MTSSQCFPSIDCPPLVPRRKIRGASAILIPVDSAGQIVWGEFESHLERTLAAGLKPAVNMDTGYVHLLSPEQKRAVLQRTQSATSSAGGYIAGAFVGDHSGDDFNQIAYQNAIDDIQKHGGTPIVFPSFGLTTGTDDQVLERYQTIAAGCDRFYGFELGQMFAPFGRIYSLPLFCELMKISNCLGLKHSSLRRDWEWERLRVRDQIRPDFQLMTGNDLAIDMVVYGSDYLLGLSTMAPDLFALRDRLWESGDGQFWQLNDVLQYLGNFAFRHPVPAYRHSAAQFLKLQGWIQHDGVFPGSPERPASDVPILQGILDQLLPYRSTLG